MTTDPGHPSHGSSLSRTGDPVFEPVRPGDPEQAPGDQPIRQVLVVDDEPSIRRLMVKALERAGYVCRDAVDGETALEMICADKTSEVDLVISDIVMPGMDGMALLKKIKAFNPGIDVIIMTGNAGQYSYVDIMDAGASDYMTKPVNINSVLAKIKRIAREKHHLIALRKTNDQLRSAIERSNQLASEADEASRAKTYFLAAMSHEIRTPLNGIVGYTDMLMDTCLDDEQKSFLESARFSCDTLLSVVNDILDFSKVESGRLHLDTISFDPEVLCFDTIDAIRTQVDESRVELICRICDTVPAKVKGDPHRLRQILLNLLGNAVKFTDQGYISLDLESRTLDTGDLGENQVLISVRISDTGIGISPENLDAIFEPFVQSESDITSRPGGTGLGLAISRNIARKMGGDLKVESTLGKGSTFYFTIPLEISPPDPGERLGPVSLQDKLVLLVSAGKDTSRILAHALESAGAKIALLPMDALPGILSGKPGPAYDLGIMDFGKSFKSGSPDISAYMSDTKPEDYPFNWMACAVPFPGIARIFDSGGFKGFIPKPVRRQLVLEMAGHLIGGAPDRVPSRPPGTMLTGHALSENFKTRVRILLVEDNPVNQRMIQLMMTRAGYRVDLAENGKVALDHYCRSAHKYDLVLMDINMPVMDGFEATLAFRTHEREKGLDPVPILALTANVLDDFKQRSQAVGMNDFLTKPIKRELVFAAIRKWVRPDL